jgi:NADH-quinone oxidoreductase subunit N
MNTPALFIVFPLIVSIVMQFIGKKPRLIVFCGVGISILLSLFALFQPFGEVLKIGRLSIEVGTELSILGRSFELTNGDRLYLVIINLLSVVWFGGARAAGVQERFISLGMLVTTCLTGALAVNPFLYSAIFIELAAIFTIPLSINPDRSIGKGVLRFLIFQSLAMPLILFGGWLLGGTQASTSDTQQLTLAVIFLGIGFSFWLAVFPFHSWVPQFSDGIHPYIAAFLLTVFPMVTMLVMLDFTTEVVWIRDSAIFSSTFQSIGLIMLLVTGVWAAFEKSAQRFLGLVVLFDTGFSLLLIGSKTSFSLETLFLAFIPRFVELALASLSLSILVNHKLTPTIKGLAGIARSFPFAVLGLVISFLSILGLPILGHFPTRMVALEMVGKINQNNIVWAILGIAMMVLPLFRLISSVTIPNNQKWVANESYLQIVFICLAILSLFIIGFFPGLLKSAFSTLLGYIPVLG